jgi:glycosyltransferase involved in cell wall biosynthesis
MRVAYFSPLPPERSGIADYSRELLPALAEQVELTLYAADPRQVDQALRRQFPIRPLAQYPQEQWQFDIPLYQMGNSQYHASFYPLLLRYPGLVVLHDYAIHHFIAHMTLDQGNFSAYAREMTYVWGVPGMQRAQAMRLGQARAAVFETPLNRRLLDSSLGLIVHSGYVADLVRQQGCDVPQSIIPALIEELPGQSRRDELQLDQNTVLFASYGVITGPKQIDLILRVFRRLRETVPNAHYLLVGEVLPEVEIAALIGELDLASAVTHIDYVPDLGCFIDWVHSADIVVNLRQPTMGETSATALRAMAAARPLIVNDLGWYAEIPEKAALKIRPADEDSLLSAMICLAQSPELRQEIGAAGRRYTRQECHPQTIAAAYVRALSSTLETYLQSHE